MFNIAVYYNNFNLASLPGVRIVDYDTTSMPNRVLSSSKLARANRSIMTSAEYSNKTVTVSGFIGGDNWQEQQDNFDRLKSYLQEPEGIVRITQGTKTLEYKGTLNGISRERHGNNMSITLEFMCSDPIGKDATTIQLFEPQNIITATFTKSLVVDGSFIAEPRYTITINSVTGGTNKTVSLLNAATGKGIKITRDWTAGDIVSVYSDTMEVVANAVVIDFKGQFPTFFPGARTLQYIDDFTARDVTLAAIYNRKYS